MKKIIKIISVGLYIFIFLSLSACNNGSSIISLFCKHEEVIDPAIEATCSYEGKTEGKYCSKCNKVLVEQVTIAKLEHQEVIDPAIEATCSHYGKTEGKHCSVCHKKLVGQELIDKIDHKEIVVDTITSTCTKWGAVGVTKCEVCNLVIKDQEFLEPTKHIYMDGKCLKCSETLIDYSNVNLYKSNYGDIFFDTAENGEAMKNLYAEMEDVLTVFHNDYSINASYFKEHEKLGSLYLVVEFNYRKYGLTVEEAKTVYSLFRRDHPIFYWITTHIVWNTTYIKISTVEDYANGKDRQKCNEKMYEGIEDYAKLTNGETSEYNIALIYYGAIIDNNSYARNEEGNPEASLWAHSVIGGFLYNKFVCEGYAKLFQLLLNLSGIENIYVSGIVSVGHGWNIVKMDDGNWYYFDLTFGENNRTKYFCVPDDSFENHTPYPSNVLGVNAQITLPEASNTAFSSEEILEIGEVFKVEGTMYRLYSYETIVLISGDAPQNDKLVYNGVVYDILD